MDKAQQAYQYRITLFKKHLGEMKQSFAYEKRDRLVLLEQQQREREEQSILIRADSLRWAFMLTDQAVKLVSIISSYNKGRRLLVERQKQESAQLEAQLNSE